MGPRMKQAEPKRVFEQWEGRNLFCCDGRVLTGPDRSSMVCTIGLVLVPKALFIILVIPRLVAYSQYFIISGVLAGFLLVLVVGAVLLCHCSDPGIIPRGPKGHKHHGPRILERKDENGRNIRMRWCETCRLYRPPRAHHCRDCGNCVEVFDHHCPWVGNCVAKRNYRYFLLFLFSTCLALAHTFAVSFVAMVLDWDNKIPGIPLIGPCTLLIVYCAVIFIPLVCLSSYHCGIVANGETTKEEIKKAYTPGTNPDDLGCVQNWVHTCCSTRPASKLTNLRETMESAARVHGTGEETDVELNVLTDAGKDTESPAPSPNYKENSRGDGYAMITLTEEEAKELGAHETSPSLIADKRDRTDSIKDRKWDDPDLVAEQDEESLAIDSEVACCTQHGEDNEADLEEEHDGAPLIIRTMDV